MLQLARRRTAGGRGREPGGVAAPARTAPPWATARIVRPRARPPAVPGRPRPGGASGRRSRRRSSRPRRTSSGRSRPGRSSATSSRVRPLHEPTSTSRSPDRGRPKARRLGDHLGGLDRARQVAGDQRRGPPAGQPRRHGRGLQRARARSATARRDPASARRGSSLSRRGGPAGSVSSARDHKMPGTWSSG